MTSEDPKALTPSPSRHTTSLPSVQFKRLHAGAHIPTRATDGSAGYDLAVPDGHMFSPVHPIVQMLERDAREVESPPFDAEGQTTLVLHPNSTVIIRTGIAIYIGDPGWEAQVRARSGIAVKNTVIIPNGIGTIDSDYQGEIMVALHNLHDESFRIRCGDRIAQLVFVPVGHPVLCLVEEFSDKTERGAGGFGSTGVPNPSTQGENK